MSQLLVGVIAKLDTDENNTVLGLKPLYVITDNV